MTSKKHTLSIKTSEDFKDDPEGAVDAIDKTGFALFIVNKKWFEDERAKKEWRFARDAKKPLIYVFNNTKEIVKEPLLLEMMQAPTLIGTVNYYGDGTDTAKYIQAMVAAYCKVNDIEL